MSSALPITFLNKDGLKLFGILHKPSPHAQQDAAIIILSPGIKSRVAPHRLYVKMARRFSEIGFHVLRFDFYGLGDSEGEITEKYVADFYGSVQVGRYVNDTVSAMDWMERECNIKRFILAGLCGGAITGLFAGAKDKRVHSLLGLGIPVILDSVNIEYERYITDGQLEHIMKERYFRNLFKWKSWLRFLTFQSDYRLIFKGLKKTLEKKITGSEEIPGKTNQVNELPQEIAVNFNRHFAKELRIMLESNKKIFFIFSGADRLYWEYREKYLKYFANDIDEYGSNLKVEIVSGANHIFSFNEWQEEMLRKSATWLK